MRNEEQKTQASLPMPLMTKPIWIPAAKLNRGWRGWTSSSKETNKYTKTKQYKKILPLQSHNNIKMIENKYAWGTSLSNSHIWTHLILVAIPYLQGRCDHSPHCAVWGKSKAQKIKEHLQGHRWEKTKQGLNLSVEGSRGALLPRLPYWSGDFWKFLFECR